MITRKFIYVILCCFVFQYARSQHIPSDIENIDFLVTFSKEATAVWGDDDHIQIHFITLPEEYFKPFYLKIFDPNIGGKHDKANGAFNSSTKFSVYGGENCFSAKDAQNVNPTGNYASGKLLEERVFDNSMLFDDKWFTLGPFDPRDGEIVESMDAYVFKVIAEGKKGNDGNMYRYFISAFFADMIAIEEANCFTYELSVQLKHQQNEVSHCFPYIQKNTSSIVQHNFDFENSGYIRLTNSVKNSHPMVASSNGKWAKSTHDITEEEQEKSVDIQFIFKDKSSCNFVIYFTDQNNEPLPIYSFPKEGMPKYKFKVNIIYDF